MTNGTGRAFRRAISALVVTGVTFAGLTACSGSSLVKKATGHSSSPAAAAVTTRTSISAVTGKIDAATQQQVSDAVTKVVDGYLDAAYLGAFPRAGFGAAFASFTDGAKAQAQHDLDLLTSARIAGQIDEADATTRRVGLDIFAAKGKAAGVTATYDVSFTTKGDLASTQRVKGSLDLTPAGGTWRIFGYAVAHGPVAPLASATPTTEVTQ